VFVGDFNNVPLITDIWSHERLRFTVSHTKAEINYLEHLRRAEDWIDPVRLKHPSDEQMFMYWSCGAENWEAASKGLRLDHIWISKNLAPPGQARRGM